MKDKRNLRSWPILLLALLTPFITYLKRVNIPEDINSYLHLPDNKVDFLTYYKGLFIILIAIIMFGILIHDWIRSKEKREKILLTLKRPVNLMALGLLVMVLVSFMFSEYKNVSLLGQYIAGEGTLHWVAYIIAFIYTQLYISVQDFESIGKGLMISAFVFFFFGLIAYMGHSLFENPVFLKVISPSSLSEVALTDVYAKRFSTFFGNPNHLGSYVALVLPLLMAYPFKASSKLLSYLVPCWLLWAMLIFSRSSAGLLGVLVSSMVFYIWLIIKKRLEVKKHIGLLLGYLLIFVVITNITGSNQLTDEVGQLKSMSNVDESRLVVTDIISEQERIVFELNNKPLELIQSDESIEFNYQGSPIQFEVVEKEGEQWFVASQDALTGFGVKMIDGSRIVISFNQVAFLIENNKAGLELYDIYGTEVKNVEIDKLGFDGVERFASSRGYIWSRSLPLIRENIIKGVGADVYALEFPQRDYLGKISTFGKYTHAVDKPHNIYLYIVISFGLVGCILFCGVIVSALVSLVKKSSDGGKTLLLSIISMCITWTFNDSMLYYASLFWILLGYAVCMCDTKRVSVDAFKAG